MSTNTIKGPNTQPKVLAPPNNSARGNDNVQFRGIPLNIVYNILAFFIIALIFVLISEKYMETKKKQIELESVRYINYKKIFQKTFQYLPALVLSYLIGIIIVIYLLLFIIYTLFNEKKSNVTNEKTIDNLFNFKILFIVLIIGIILFSISSIIINLSYDSAKSDFDRKDEQITESTNESINDNRLKQKFINKYLSIYRTWLYSITAGLFVLIIIMIIMFYRNEIF